MIFVFLLEKEPAYLARARRLRDRLKIGADDTGDGDGLADQGTHIVMRPARWARVVVRIHVWTPCPRAGVIRFFPSPLSYP